MKSTRRRIIMVDQEVQGALILRAALYWFYCLLSVSLMVLCWSIFHGPKRPFSAIASDLLINYAPALAASLILLPMVLVDVVRFSHLFVGPMYRLKWAMSSLAKGEKVEPITFREEDYWSEFASEFNRMLAKVKTGELSETLSDQGPDALKTVGDEPFPADKTVCA